jgi:branched-chain amino acid transport system permease protein/urea transport system permease protein
VNETTTTVLALSLPVDSFNVVVLMGTYVLVALGLHYSFGLLGIVNLAHGEFLLIGAYTAFWVHQETGSVLLGMALAPVVAGAVGLVAERLVLRRLHARVLDTLLATFGLALLIRQGVQYLFSPNPRNVPDPVGGSFTLWTFNIPYWRGVLVLVAVVAVAGSALVLTRTDLGLRWRATVRNADLAETLGIGTVRARATLFAVGSGVAGLAGAVLAPLSSVTPQFGIRFLVPAFLVVILGGQGSLRGLVVAGVLLGGALGVMQFHLSTVNSQMIVIVLAILAIRVRDRAIEMIAVRRAARTSYRSETLTEVPS